MKIPNQSTVNACVFGMLADDFFFELSSNGEFFGPAERCLSELLLSKKNRVPYGFTQRHSMAQLSTELQTHTHTPTLSHAIYMYIYCGKKADI